MSDYKELIETLNALLSLNDENLSERVIANNDVQNALLQAADAIEQLVRERDAAVADLNVARSCLTCKSDGLDFCEGCDSWASKRKWEWRGAQE